MRRSTRNGVVPGLAALALAVLLPGGARAGNRHSDWYDGDVDIDVRVAGGEGTIVYPGQRVRLQFEVNEDAYVLVYALDTDGSVRLLFPRFWEDDGWVEAGRPVRLGDRSLAWPVDDWSGNGGVVYVQAIASPRPFDWDALGCVVHDGRCEWRRHGAPMSIDGDPLLGFNEVNHCIFPDWDRAVFVADYTYFYVGRYYDHPRYLYDPYPGYCPAGYDPWLRVSLHVNWWLDRGSGYCRPVYLPHYLYRREPGIERKRYVHDGGDPAGRGPEGRRWDERTRRRGGSRGWEDDPPEKSVRAREERQPIERNLELPDPQGGGNGVRKREILQSRLRVPMQPVERLEELPVSPPAGDRSPSPAGPETEIRRRDPESERALMAHGAPRVAAPERGATPPVPESDSGDRQTPKRSLWFAAAPRADEPRAHRSAESPPTPGPQSRQDAREASPPTQLVTQEASPHATQPAAAPFRRRKDRE